MSKRNGKFGCEVGHLVSAETLERSADLRLAEALWMAIQALDNEAEMLQAIGGDSRFAEQAAEQARLLRDFASAQSPRVSE